MAPREDVHEAGGRIVRAAEASWVVTLLFEVVWLWFWFENSSPSGSYEFASPVTAILAFQSMATIGVLITRSDPRNAEGWLFCAAPLLMTAGNLFGDYATYALNTSPGVLPGGVIAGQFGNLWLIGASLFISFVILLFPDGRMPGPRWRWLGWVGGVSLVGLWAGLLVTPGHLDQPLERYRNPLGIDGFQYLAFVGLAVPVVAVAGVVSAVVRYRRGDRVERQQLRWFVTAVCLSAVFFVAAAAFQALTGFSLPAFVILAFMWLVPAAVGIAILRYRLYEIDVIIRKTLVYGALVAALALVYLGGVSLLGWAFTSVSGQSGALAVTLSTLAVAAAFQPLRARIQEAVDRRFYRRKYDAARALEAFGGRLRQQVDLDALHGEVLAVVHQTVQPATASLWLRS